ncbi:TPA: ATP-dependent helicase [Candidatus Latescibacteria bacterium]|nr:ATP-dependent helicase [Candidatus Latescibacterota bacterium]
MKYAELVLKPEIQTALHEMGYEDLTPIQEEAIPHILENKDLIGLAETGSGKTGACAVPLVEMVDPAIREIQALILVPTRELAQQYVSEIADVSKHSDVAPFAMFGGFDMDIQRAKLKDGVHILVATPGRLIDYIWNNPLPLDNVRTVVLDEADEMMKMGFIENVDFIFSCIMQEVQTLLFSATMPKAVARLAKMYQTDPVRLELNKDQVAPQSLMHCFRVVKHGNQEDELYDYLRSNEIGQGLVFCNSRSRSSQLFRQIRSTQPSVEIIHGGLDQPQRSAVFRKFKNKEIDLLVATDVAARGLDFNKVTHVINYDFPMSDEAYTHRTGRAGRMGREGVAVTFVTNRDLGALGRLIRANGIEPVWLGEEPELHSSRPSGPRRRRRGGRGPGRSSRRRSRPKK